MVKISCSALGQKIGYFLCYANFEVLRDSGLVFVLSVCLPSRLPSSCTAFPRPSRSMHFVDVAEVNCKTVRIFAYSSTNSQTNGLE